MFPVIENQRGSMPELNANFRNTYNQSPLFFQKRGKINGQMLNSSNFKSSNTSKKMISKNNDLHEVYLIHQKTPIKKNL
jgi:hypothetical protein